MDASYRAFAIVEMEKRLLEEHANDFPTLRAATIRHRGQSYNGFFDPIPGSPFIAYVMKGLPLDPEVAELVKGFDPERTELTADPSMDFSRDQAYLKLVGNELKDTGPEELPYLAQFAWAGIRQIMEDARKHEPSE